MEFTEDNLNELDWMLRWAIMELVDPRFDNMEDTLRVIIRDEIADMVRYEVLVVMKPKVKEIDHRLNRLEKASP